jgi:hypothetical protein
MWGTILKCFYCSNDSKNTWDFAKARGHNKWFLRTKKTDNEKRIGRLGCIIL